MGYSLLVWPIEWYAPTASFRTPPSSSLIKSGDLSLPPSLHRLLSSYSHSTSPLSLPPSPRRAPSTPLPSPQGAHGIARRSVPPIPRARLPLPASPRRPAWLNFATNALWVGHERHWRRLAGGPIHIRMELSVAAAAVELGKRGRPEDQDHDQEQDHGDAKRLALVPWPPHQQHPSSRIYRVSRGSGGKDRHSKVYTAKGIRDRRVRLSVATAIQFYDLQDRLGYDQPSKAVEWLIKAAAAAIDKLPELDAAAFPNHPASASANKQSSALHAEADGSQLQQQQLTRSGCSSTSETSKGSVLSLSRSDSRVKARERARDRSASVKDKDDSVTAAVRRRAPSAQAASFTELLTGLAAATPAVAQHKQHNSWQQMTASATADYLGFSQPRKSGHGMLHTFASPAPHLGNIVPVAMAPAQHFSLSAGGGDSQTDMPHFSFSQDHYMPVHAAPASAPAVDYSLNFSMCSGLVGVNNTRGTLQSNSQPHLSGHHHHQQQLQRLSTPLDAPHIPFLFSPAVAVASPTTAESHFGAAAALQLWEGFRHSDMKEKGKN
ncbi:hypothetical protein VPH35_020947 [Triticum aestivum]|uniref:Uncharacterized protein n=3 Tax=Triticum TaxID=4564 RepID=A0A9R1NSY9_TRITD|nr:unnamed protein product [Triticum turgidum subsp. durum]